MRNLGDETYLSWSTCFLAFLPGNTARLIFSLAAGTLYPEAFDFPKGQWGVVLCLSEWAIDGILADPLLLRMLLHFAHSTRNRLDPGLIQVLVMGLGGVLATCFMNLLAGAAVGTLDAAAVTQSWRWFARFLGLMTIILTLFSFYFATLSCRGTRQCTVRSCLRQT